MSEQDMKADPKLPVVLVTGAAGYIASHLIRLLLERGYKVRGTTRSLDPVKNRHLLDLPGAGTGLELVTADLLTEGSFDEAVRGCAYVFHTASPVIFATKNPQKDLFDPALKGTLNVLTACTKAGHVKRVVLTASVAGVVGMVHEQPEGHVFDESDWTKDEAKEYAPYNYSKKIAEKAAWAYWETLSGPEKFELVAVNPGIVVGPYLNAAALPESMGVLSPICEGMPLPDFRFSYVDVRDVVKVHVALLEHPDASGRYLVHSADNLSFWDVGKMIRQEVPEVSPSSLHMPKLFQYFAPLVDSRVTLAMVHHQHGAPYKISRKKLDSLLGGFEYIPIQQSLRDAVRCMVANGHIKGLKPAK